MFTQCSRCDTVFRLSAETLRAAGGQVRCGRCGEVFNALARLAEDASAFPAGESLLEMEARADEILHSPAAPAAPAPPLKDEDLEAADVDFARLQLIDKYKPPRPEDDAPPRPDAATPPQAGPLPPPPPRSPAPSARAAPVAGAGRAAPKPADAPPSAPSPPSPSPPSPSPPSTSSPSTPPPAVESGPEPDASDEGSLEFTLPPGELDRIFVDPTAGRTQQSSFAAEAKIPRSPAGARAPGLVSEDVRRDMLAGLQRRDGNVIEDSIEPSPAAHRAWTAAAAALALLLLIQVLHENREWLAANAPLRGPLRGLYAAMGVSVQVPANLASYQLRQWGVTGDPSAAGTLRVRASILNTAPQLQPYPLLRVTLANRFGARIGTRDFEPSEYLGKPTVRMMAPGERADALLDILDPGKEAEGFEIDVCLRGADHKITCTADAAPQAGAAPASHDR